MSAGAISAAPPAERLFRSRIFSFPVMLAAALALVTFLTCRSRFHDPDTWWHLKIGQIIWETRTLPRADLLSHTTGNHAWIAHEWLAELSMYAAYKFGGPQGLLFWLSGLASLLVILLYALCALCSGNAKVAFVGGLAGWFFGTVGLAIRPLILGHLFLVIELLILHLSRTRSRRWLWTLPLLFALWVNCHGSYALGLAVLLVHCFCGGRLQAIAVFCACVAALFVNPVGVDLVTYPLDLVTRQTDNLANVTEWAPLDLHDTRGLAFLAIMLLIGALAVRRRAVPRLEELLLLLLGATMAFRHTRMLFVFGILAAPLLCRLLAVLWTTYDRARDNCVANGVLTATAIAILIASLPGPNHIEAQVKRNNPVAAVDFIRHAGLAGPMLNEYLWGGYLIWTLPEHKVFIDGRTDIFAWTGVLAEYGRWYTLQDDPQTLLNQYGIRFCLLRRDAPMSHVLPYLPGWKKLYADDLSVIFAREAR